MANNFNVGNFNTLKVDDNKTSNTTNKNDDKDKLRKKILLMTITIFGVLILLLLILFIASLFTKKVYSYRDLENVLKTAAINYYKDNDSNLPTADDQTSEIDSGILVSGEYMKDFSSLTKEGTICTGRVVVSKNGNDYKYTPYLDCGEKYITKKLYEKVIDSKNIVTEGYGLYASNNGYVFKGETVDNYVKLDGALWRIIKVTSDNKIVLLYADQFRETINWDDRYNAQDGYNSGLNNYSASRVYEYLDALYENNVKDEKILSKNDRKLLVNYNLCIGKRDLGNDSKDNSVECSETLSNKKIGLLTVADYINASIDSNCSSTISESCQNYNYLNSKFQWWLMTASNTSTSTVYYVNRNGGIKEARSLNYAYVRPVVVLNDNVLFAKGNGSEKSPYKVR